MMMKRRHFCTLPLLAALPAVAAPTLSDVPALPRKADEFAFQTVDGKQHLLSQYRGKVCIMEFLFTTCPHCQHEAQLLSKLQTAYASKGLQVLGCAYNEMAVMLVPDFIKQNNVNFPVGFAARESVMSWMNFGMDLMVSVPQVAIVDKSGMIVAQTPPRSDPKFQDEAYLRQTIEHLLAQPAPTTKVSANTKPTVHR